MLQYVCVVTNEFESASDYFVNSVSFHASYIEADIFGSDKVKSLLGESDYFIYRNLSISEDDFLNNNADSILPFS